MDPVALYTLFNEWSPLVLAIFTFIVTASTLALKMTMTYVTKRREIDPSYSMGPFVIHLIALLTALSQNSKSAAELKK